MIGSFQEVEFEFLVQTTLFYVPRTLPDWPVLLIIFSTALIDNAITSWMDVFGNCLFSANSLIAQVLKIATRYLRIRPQVQGNALPYKRLSELMNLSTRGDEIPYDQTRVRKQTRNSTCVCPTGGNCQTPPPAPELCLPIHLPELRFYVPETGFTISGNGGDRIFGDWPFAFGTNSKFEFKHQIRHAP